jgi:tetratricopeptide (TPR) repeat protein
VRRLEDKNFEVFCLQLLAAHERFTGRYAESRRDLEQAMTIAHDRNFVDAIPSLLLDDGRVLMETGHYEEAREVFTRALASEGATKTAEILIDLARVQALLGDAEHARETLARARQLPEAAGGDVVPRLRTAGGELAYASGNMPEAHAAFTEAARLWTDDLPDSASVQARSYVGYLDGLAGRGSGRAALTASLQQARRMRRPGLETTARVFLARLDLQVGQPAVARDGLAGVAMETIGPELQAQVHHWRGESAAALGDAGAAQADRREAARILEQLREGVPEALRPRFLSRPDIRAISP